MKRVVTIDEMRKIEHLTFSSKNIDSFTLMTNVGKAIYKKFRKEFSVNRMLIVAGPGNNGGDALVFGEQAFKDEMVLEVLMVGRKDKQSKESILMTKRYQDKGIPISFVKTNEEFESYISTLKEVDVIIDGLFGIGLSKDVGGLYKDVIEWINRQNTQVLSIDIPSGLHADTGIIMGVAVDATMTYTIEVIKQGMLLEDGLDVVGKLSIVDGEMADYDSGKYLLENFLSPPKRRHNTHKYHYKNVLTIGGQKGVMGAITLAGYSALVSGAGLSTVATNIVDESRLIQAYPELMYESIDSIKDLEIITKKKDAILFGLGMRNITEFEQIVFNFITDLSTPIILDAGGIELLKTKKKLQNKRVVITPHYGEFSKLMNVEVSMIKQDPLFYIHQCIKQYDCEIILKGPSTIYARKDSIIYANQGTPVLAKAGSGDVLAGIILTYVARDFPLEQGILLHMLSGKNASQSSHIESVLASDIIAKIPTVYASHKEERK